MRQKSDICVLGAGPAGYRAALEAVDRGLSTTLVEQGPLGGTCLNWGCIPTKIMLAASGPGLEIDRLSRHKVLSGSARTDNRGLKRRIQGIVKASRQAMHDRLQASGVQVLFGRGHFTSATELEVQQGNQRTTLSFEKAILACGSSPQVIHGLEPDGELVLDSSQILGQLPTISHLAIIGAGAIGLELADYYSQSGAQIELIELQNRLAPEQDPEISSELAKAFKRRKWKVHTGCTVQDIQRGTDRALLKLSSGQEISAEKVLVATGRRPNSRGLGLRTLGCQLDKDGWVQTNPHLQALDNIYAPGDINGRYLLAHAAEDQARHAILHASGLTSTAYTQLPPPSCIYCTPEVMRAGWGVSELLAQGRPVQTAKVSLAANPMAQAHGQPQGLIKTVWSGSRLAGVTAVGCRVTHLVTLAEIMVRQGWTSQDLPGYIFAHPSLDESLREALSAPRQEVNSKD